MRKARSNTQSDSDKIKDAFQKLRAENRKLKKENGQLRKELTKFSNLEFEATLDLEVDAPKIPSKEVHWLGYCFSCKSDNLGIVPAGMFTIIVCNSCGHRRRIKV